MLIRERPKTEHWVTKAHENYLAAKLCESEELLAPAASRYYWTIFLLSITYLDRVSVIPPSNWEGNPTWTHVGVYRALKMRKRTNWDRCYRKLMKLRVQADYYDMAMDPKKFDGVQSLVEVTSSAMLNQIGVDW